MAIDPVTLGAAKSYTDKAIESVNPDAYLGVTTTPLSDGATTNPITIDGKSVTAKNSQIAAYADEEFIFNGTTWRKFGGSFAGLVDVNINTPTSGQMVQYDATSQKFVNGMKITTLIETLETGETDVVFSNAAITNTARYDVYNDLDIPYDDKVLSGTTMTITYAEQESDMSVKLVITEDV